MVVMALAKYGMLDENMFNVSQRNLAQSGLPCNLMYTLFVILQIRLTYCWLM